MNCSIVEWSRSTWMPWSWKPIRGRTSDESDVDNFVKRQVKIRSEWFDEELLMSSAIHWIAECDFAVVRIISDGWCNCWWRIVNKSRGSSSDFKFFAAFSPFLKRKTNGFFFYFVVVFLLIKKKICAMHIEHLGKTMNRLFDIHLCLHFRLDFDVVLLLMIDKEENRR